MQTRTSNILNHNSDETSVSPDSLDVSMTVKVTNMLEALVTAFGGWSQIDDTDIARALAAFRSALQTADTIPPAAQETV